MKYLSLLFAAVLAMPAAVAGPGAHGPNGEHLDAQGKAAGTVSSVPRIETFTESFELLGQLSSGELSVMIDRYETNEPVLNGILEVQYQNIKAKATFHADHGDYAIDDPALLAAISKPGAHALLFTLVAGEDSDLLEGTLQVSALADDHTHGHSAWRRWLSTAIACLVLIAAVFAVRRLRQRKETA